MHQGHSKYSTKGDNRLRICNIIHNNVSRRDQRWLKNKKYNANDLDMMQNNIAYSSTSIYAIRDVGDDAFSGKIALLEIARPLPSNFKDRFI